MKKLLCKSSILIPITMVFFVLVQTPSLSITEINLYLNWIYTQIFYIAFTLIWLCCSPLRKSCCNGNWTEVLFNLVPIEVFAFVIFAQWHFAIAVILAAAMLVFYGLVIRAVRKDEKRRRFSEKRHGRYIGGLQRFAVLFAAVFSAVPLFMSVFVYEMKSPHYMAEREIRESLFEDENGEGASETADPYAANKELFLYFEESAWSKLDIREKVTVAQELLDFESQQLGIPDIRITTEKLDEFTLGQYGDETNQIWIDIDHLANSPAEDCIRTICHEAWHSAQFYIVDHIDWESQVFQTAYFAELREWRDNKNDYQKPRSDGYDAYKSQPLEEAARAYADDETERILSYYIICGERSL